MNIIEFAKKYKSAMSKIDDIKKEAVLMAGDDIANAVVDQQVQGIDKEGKKITPKYSNKYYARNKYKQNSAPGYGTPDLKLSGDTHNSLYIKLQGNKVEYDAKTNYFKYIKSRYDSAFGVAEKNLESIWKITTPIFKQLFTKLLA